MTEAKLKRLYNSSHRYKKASLILSGDTSLILQACVNQALALELILKCLLFIDQENHPKAPRHNTYTHSHKKLFTWLNNHLRKEMINEFAKFIAEERNLKTIKSLEKEAKIKIPRDLMGTWKEWGKIFVDARYEHQLEGKELSMMFFKELFNMVDKQIKHYRPQW